jgi:hypothetical protein
MGSPLNVDPRELRTFGSAALVAHALPDDRLAQHKALLPSSLGREFTWPSGLRSVG